MRMPALEENNNQFKNEKSVTQNNCYLTFE